jgi:hypothetical protein
MKLSRGDKKICLTSPVHKVNFRSVTKLITTLPHMCEGTGGSFPTILTKYFTTFSEKSGMKFCARED